MVPDHNDGLGPRLRPRLEAIADDGPGWVLWPGRWGATRRREFFEADSPRGPREQPHWWDPAELHREARAWTEGDGANHSAQPPKPEIEARREGDLAVVSYSFPRPRPQQGEPARIVAAPFDGDGEPSGTQSFAVEGPQGSFAVQLPAGRRWEGVRAGVTSHRGIPGETLAASFAG